MAKKQKQEEKKESEILRYKSALCDLSSAAARANIWAKEGYEVKWCFAVVGVDQEGKPQQCIWMLAERLLNEMLKPGL
jgi:hypothetical protein